MRQLTRLFQKIEGKGVEFLPTAKLLIEINNLKNQLKELQDKETNNEDSSQLQDQIDSLLSKISDLEDKISKLEMTTEPPVTPSKEELLTQPVIPITRLKTGETVSFECHSESLLLPPQKIREFILTIESPYTRRVFAADDNGNSIITFSVPENMSSMTISLQAVDVLGNTSRISKKKLPISDMDYIKAPVILHPNLGASIKDGTDIVVTVSEDYGNSGDTLISTDYKICSDANGNFAVLSSINNASLFSYTFREALTSDALEADTYYWIFARFKGERLGYSDWSVGTQVNITSGIISSAGRILYRHSSNMGTVMEFKEKGIPRKILVLDARYRESVTTTTSINSKNVVPGVVASSKIIGSNYTAQGIITGNVNIEDEIIDAAIYPFSIQSPKTVTDYLSKVDFPGNDLMKYCNDLLVYNDRCALVSGAFQTRIISEQSILDSLDPTAHEYSTRTVKALSSSRNNVISCTPYYSGAGYSFYYLYTTNSGNIYNYCCSFDYASSTSKSARPITPIIELESSQPLVITAPSGRKYYRHESGCGTVMCFNENGLERKVLVLDAKFRTSQLKIVASDDDLDSIEELSQHSSNNTKNNSYLDGVSSSSENYKLLTDEQIDTIWGETISDGTARDNGNVLKFIPKMKNSILYDTYVGVDSSVPCERDDYYMWYCDIPDIQTLIRIFCDRYILDYLDSSFAGHKNEDGTFDPLFQTSCIQYNNPIPPYYEKAFCNKSGDWVFTNTSAYKDIMISSTRGEGNSLLAIDSTGVVSSLPIELSTPNMCPVIELWPIEIESPHIISETMNMGKFYTKSFIHGSEFNILQGMDNPDSFSIRVCSDSNCTKVAFNKEFSINKNLYGVYPIYRDNLVRASDSRYMTNMFPILGEYVDFSELTVGNTYYISIRYKSKQGVYSEWSDPLKVKLEDGILSSTDRVFYRHSSNMGTIMEYITQGIPKSVLILDNKYRTTLIMGAYNNAISATCTFVNSSTITYNTNLTDSICDELVGPYLEETCQHITDEYIKYDGEAALYCRSILVGGEPCNLPTAAILMRVIADEEILNLLDKTINDDSFYKYCTENSGFISSGNTSTNSDKSYNIGIKPVISETYGITLGYYQTTSKYYRNNVKGLICPVLEIPRKYLSDAEMLLPNGQPNWEGLYPNNYMLTVDENTGAVAYVGRSSPTSNATSEGDGYKTTLWMYPSGTYDIYMVSCGSAGLSNHTYGAKGLIEKHTLHLDGITPIFLRSENEQVTFSYKDTSFSVENKVVKRASGGTTVVNGVTIEGVWIDEKLPSYAKGGQYYYGITAPDPVGLGCGGWAYTFYVTGTSNPYSYLRPGFGGPGGVIIFRTGN